MKAKRRLLIAGIVIGALLSMAPIFGAAGTAFGMMRSFQTMGASGPQDPQALSENIGFALSSTALGMLLCPIGIVILVASIVMLVRMKQANPPQLPPRLGD